jgi:hypothetical protein
MYLLFETLGRLNDRELMLLNLDLLNPFEDVRSATIAIPPAEGRKVRLSENGEIVGPKLASSSTGSTNSRRVLRCRFPERKRVFVITMSSLGD